MSDERKLEIHYADEWAALYVDGKLERVGDSYLAEERAFEILGVRIVQDDAFMRGQKRADGVAQSINEVEALREQREENRRRAAELRHQAERLLQQAGELDRSQS
jgi:hypothetical protein